MDDCNDEDMIIFKAGRTVLVNKGIGNLWPIWSDECSKQITTVSVKEMNNKFTIH